MKQRLIGTALALLVSTVDARGQAIPQFSSGEVPTAAKVNAATAAAAAAGTAGALASLAQVANLGQIEVGLSTGQPAYIDFHALARNPATDFDARIIASGGTTQLGGTDLTFLSTRANFLGTLRAGRQTAGQGDAGAVASFIANSARGDNGGQAGVLGYTPGLSALSYGDIDSVTLYTENTGRPPFFVVTGATFSVSGGTARVLMPAGSPLTPAQMARLFPGLQIVTNHVQPWVGWIETWAADGTWVQVTGGFGHFGGSEAPGQDPTGSPVQGGGPVQVAFAPLTKTWLQNSNCFLGQNVDGVRTIGPFTPKKCAGYELGLFNNLGTDHSYDGQYNSDPNGYTWGFDAVSLGGNRASAGFIARGNMDAGFQSEISGRYGFLVDGATPTGVGFATFQNGGSPFTYSPGGPGHTAFFMSPEGALEIGRTDVAGSPFIDFHSSGSAGSDYDARVIVSGGTGAGNGTMFLQSGTLQVLTQRTTFSGVLTLASCPGSPTGLSTGDLWCNGGIVNRVP